MPWAWRSLGVVGFPLLFDSQPRPIAIDIPIEIPGKNTVKPLAMPALPSPAQATTAPAASAAVTGSLSDKVAAASSLSSKEEILTEKKSVQQAAPGPSAIKTEVKPVLKTEPKAEPKAEPRSEQRSEQRAEAKPAPKTPDPADDGARARALLNGQAAAAGNGAGAVVANAPVAAGASDERLVVQVGAFADATKATEVRAKLEKAGLKTYTQIAETSSGKRIRVRVGPFGSKAEAEKVATKIKSLDLPAAILAL